MHTTPSTRPRCERLADRTEYDPILTALSVVPLLALVHPVAPVAALLLLCDRRIGRTARSPTGHGRVRRPV